jgi:hypothetical protein
MYVKEGIENGNVGQGKTSFSAPESTRIEMC